MTSATPARAPAARPPAPSPWRGFRPAAYFLASLVVLDTLSNILRSVLPAMPSDALWRQTSSVLLGQSGELWIVAFLILLITAICTDDARVTRMLTWLGLVGCIVFLAVAVRFVFDARFLSGFLPVEQRPRFTVVSFKGEWHLTVSALALGAIGLVSRRWNRRQTTPPVPETATPAAPAAGTAPPPPPPPR